MTRASPPANTAAGAARRRGAAARAAADDDATSPVQVRQVRRSDLDPVIEIDAIVTGLEKRTYWRSIFRRYGSGDRPERHFLVAEVEGRVVGFVIGEVRDWEFGEPPCGWVFAINVDPQSRLGGIATRMLQALSAGFRRSGVRKLRTILARDNTLILSFFRSQGMTTGPFIPLEMDLDA
ncbi:MAG: GNAT family N-acetyltransferase [Burkholderiales bacterium]|nr:GNAT family N-acetyltransferase [Burkholderiales bacterium]